MELADLDNLTSAELRKLITLVARQTTLKNYQHKCSDQRYCMACRKHFCHACYNLHLLEIHGPQAASFNGKLEESSSLFLPERKEIKVKVKVSVKVKGPRVGKQLAKKETPTLKEISEQAKAGKLTKEQIEAIIQVLEGI